MTSSQITMWNYHTKRTWTRFLLKKYLVKLAQDEYIWMLLHNLSEPIMIGFACLCLQFFRTDFPTEPLNFVKYFASFFRRNKTKIRCNYWENVKFSKVEQTKLGSNHWFSNTYLRLILMITYAKIIAFVSVEILL